MHFGKDTKQWDESAISYFGSPSIAHLCQTVSGGRGLVDY